MRDLISVLLLSSMMTVGLGFRPKGVRAELASLYNPNMDFKCLDGSNTVPFIQVNDDYCDCDDGSDEPGTSACPSGKFYCENAGHKALVLPSSRVGDGICDCCDGSDEWERDSSCSNTCSEMGRAAREAAEAQAKLAMAGYTIRQGMVEEAKRLQEEKVAELADKETRKVELQALKEIKEQEKVVAEAPEKEALDFYRQLEEEEKVKKEAAEKAAEEVQATEYFVLLDINNDGVITMEELQTRPGLDTNKDGEVSEEEAKFFLSDNESFDLESFVTTGYVLLKPYLDLETANQVEEIEQAEFEQQEEEDLVPPAEEFHAPDYPMATPAPDDPEAPDHPMMTPEPPTYDEEEYEDEEDSEDYDINDHDEDDDLEQEMPEADSPKEEKKYDEATQEIIDNAEAARKAYNDADRELKDVEREMKDLKEVLEKDFGSENEFMVLQGQCFEYTDNEYKYKMCPFDHCSQRGKSGGSETRLGSWGEWVGPEGAGRYSRMKFTGGQGCWNGPARSTLVHLHCGSENTLSQVSEPNRCEYEMHFTTPAVCYKHSAAAAHDEL